ncbi:MAG: CaiB/BaiF CoA-transferase family protein [Pseudomonadota bacterium]
MENNPLNHVRVIDFSTLLPGPYASMLLVNMGADVVKVESPTRPDLIKSLPPIINGQSAADQQLNRGKRSIALDLKSEGGLNAARRLAAHADVVLEQFRPGVMDRLGLGFGALKQLNKSLVYCSISGYGQTGPWSQRAGHDINYVSISGAASYSGREGQGPQPSGMQWADLAGGSHHAVMGILAALFAARETGEGRHVDISMTDAMFALNGLAGAAALATGCDPAPESEMLNGGSFYDHYQCACGGYLALGGLEPQFVETLAIKLDDSDLLGLKALHDGKTQGQLKSRLRERFASKSRDHWLRTFGDADVCVTPVLTINQAANHEQLVAREMVILANGETPAQLGDPIKFVGSRKSASRDPAPRLGQHTRELLNDIGFAEREISEMAKTGVVHCSE